MASNYNLVPRPAVLLVSEVMERREVYEDVLAHYGWPGRDGGIDLLLCDVYIQYEGFQCDDF